LPPTAGNTDADGWDDGSAGCRSTGDPFITSLTASLSLPSRLASASSLSDEDDDDDDDNDDDDDEDEVEDEGEHPGRDEGVCACTSPFRADALRNRRFGDVFVPDAAAEDDDDDDDDDEDAAFVDVGFDAFDAAPAAASAVAIIASPSLPTAPLDSEAEAAAAVPSSLDDVKGCTTAAAAFFVGVFVFAFVGVAVFVFAGIFRFTIVTDSPTDSDDVGNADGDDDLKSNTSSADAAFAFVFVFVFVSFVCVFAAAIFFAVARHRLKSCSRREASCFACWCTVSRSGLYTCAFANMSDNSSRTLSTDEYGGRVVGGGVAAGSLAASFCSMTLKSMGVSTCAR
jgi:hypothetical protein